MATFLKERFDNATLETLADFICGDDTAKYPTYRSSSYLTFFFRDIGIDARHDGSTRKWWTLDTLKFINSTSLDNLEKVVLRLLDIREYKADKEKLGMAAKAMNNILFMENLRIEFRGRDPLLLPLDVTIKPIVNVGVDAAAQTEEAFLQKEFEQNDISKIGLEGTIETILKNRIEEARECLAHRIYLSSIFMGGSALEGLLLGIASKHPKEFNQATSSPKDRDGKVKALHDWTLNDFINTAHDARLLGLDVKKFGHALRDFRNYIHPFEQLSSGFSPDEHTAKICLQVLNAAIADLIKSAEAKNI